MSAKKILAGIFAVIILVKLIILVTMPHLWMGAVEALLGHQTPVTAIYLVLLVITGYYVFASLDIIDIAVTMFFTSMLLAVSILPYASVLLKMRGEIMGIGLGKAWLALLLWGALAVAVLYKIFSTERGQFRSG
jgi:hypothetical protein